MRVEKSDGEWQRELTPQQYRVLREKARSRPSRGSTGTSMQMASTGARRAASRCSTRRRSSSPEPAGRASTSPSRASTLGRKRTEACSCAERGCTAHAAAVISATCSTTGRSRRVCATASIQRRWNWTARTSSTVVARPLPGVARWCMLAPAQEMMGGDHARIDDGRAADDSADRAACRSSARRQLVTSRQPDRGVRRLTYGELFGEPGGSPGHSKTSGFGAAIASRRSAGITISMSRRISPCRAWARSCTRSTSD